MKPSPSGSIAQSCSRGLCAFVQVLLVAAASTLALQAAAVSTPASSASGAAPPVQRLDFLPGGLRFAANAGQWPDDVSFRTVGLGHAVAIARGGVFIELGNGAGLRMRVAGANQSLPAATGLLPARARANFHVGPAERHRTGVAVYRKLMVPGVYPGTNLTCHGTADGRMEYDFELDPGADPSLIGLRFDHRVPGGEWTPCQHRLLENGNLEVQAGPDWTAVFTAPRSFQDMGGVSLPIDSSFVLREGGVVAFELGAYDPAKPLRIDPELLYAATLRPSGTSTYEADDVAIDSLGNAWVIGQVDGAGFPVTPDAESGSNAGANDVGAMLLDPQGELIYATYLGGSNNESAQAVVVANDDSVWICGTTSSTNFPVSVDAAQATNRGLSDAFLVKLDVAGQLDYGTYLGSPSSEGASRAMAIDRNDGSVWFCGSTSHIDFPTTGNAFQPEIAWAYGVGPSGTIGSTDLFIVKYSGEGALLYSTYFGSGDFEDPGGIDVDSEGNAWITGTVSGSSGWPPAFPATGNARQPQRALDASGAKSPDAFIAKFSPAGALLYASFLGGEGYDEGHDVVVTAEDEVWILGTTSSSDFEVTANATYPFLEGIDSDVFLHRYDSSGTTLLFGSFFGGSGLEGSVRGAVDADDNVWVTGYTLSRTNFPIDLTAAQPLYMGAEGLREGYFAGISPDGEALYSTYLGGSGFDFPLGIAVDGSNVAWVVGLTNSSDFARAGNVPEEPPWTGTTGDAWFISRFGLGQPPLRLILLANPKDPAVGETVTLTARVVNNLGNHVTEIAPTDLLSFTGSGSLKVVSGPDPAVLAALGPGEIQNFTWELKAEERGDVFVTLQMSGFDQSGDPVFSGRITSSPIRVGSRGDLKIRGDFQAETSYAINNIYQTLPSGLQVSRVASHPEGSAEFKILVENDAPEENSSHATAFVLQARSSDLTGWTLACTADGADITESITSFGGWETPRLDSGESQEISVTLTPDPGIPKSVERSVSFSLLSTDTSDDVLDAVEARVVVENAFLTVDPPEALLGEPVTVQLHFFNDSTTAMTQVTPALGILPDPLGDAEASEPVPANVAVLQPGEEAVFTWQLKGTEKGIANLLGQASFLQNGGGPFFTSQIPFDLKLDVIEAIDLVPIQVILDVPMISGKPTLALLTTLNPLSLSKEVDVELVIQQPGLTDQVFEASVTFDPGEDREAIPGESWFTIKSTADLEATLFPDDPDVPAYAGKDISTEVETIQTQQLNCVWARVEFAPGYSLPALSPSLFTSLVNEWAAFLDATYPMVPVGSPRTDVLRVDWSTRPVTPATIHSAASRKAVRDGLDRLAVVVPPAPSLYPAAPGASTSLLGYTMQEDPKTVFLLAHSPVFTLVDPILTDPSTAAHEFGHTFGFPDMLQIREPDVDFGIWVERHESFEDRFNFMSYETPAWINKDTYEVLISRLSRPLVDPVVLLLSGTITPGGAVMADPFSTITTDQLSVSDPAGGYVFEFLGAGGSVLKRFRFGLSFDFSEAVIAADGSVQMLNAQLAEAPFSFSVVRPPGLARVVLRGPSNQTLFSRDVSAGNPVVSNVTLTPATNPQPGQQRTISWVGSDPDGDPLTYAVSFSDDGGATWKLVCEFRTGNQFTWAVPDAPTLRGRVKVEASDGMNSGEGTSANFNIVSNRVRLIVSPGPKLVTAAGTPVSLNGSASHSTDGRAVTYQWELVGQPAGGNGAITSPTAAIAGFSASVPGLYMIRLTVKSPNPRSLTASAITSVFVEDTGLPELRMLSGANGSFVLSWPLSAPGAMPEMSDDLDQWFPVPEIPGQDDDNYILHLDPTASSRKFFRLSRPGSP